MRYSLLYIALAFLLSYCIEPLDTPQTTPPDALIVDGMITSDSGPYYVKLSTFYKTGDEIAYSGATVTIEDGEGNVESLPEVEPGVYASSINGMQGQVGKSYKLKIIAKDGVTYESELATMKPAGTVSDITFEYFDELVNLFDPKLRHDGFEVRFSSTGAEGSNLFRWRWKGTYEVLTFPELRTWPGPDGLPIPHPYPCSGYVFDDNGFRQVSACECCSCWPNDFSTQAMVSNNEFVNDQTFTGVLLTKIPVDQYRFYAKYYIEVEQLSVSESVYDFWKLVQVQQSGATNIFQPNVVKIKGNMTCTSDPSKLVFGLFGVSAIARKGIMINRNEIPGVIPPIDQLAVDCRLYFEASNQKPAFW